MSELSKELREVHWCEDEEWTCNNCLAADEIESLSSRLDEAKRVMRQIEEALRHGFSVEPGSFLHDEVTRLCSGGPNQQREAKKLAAMSPEDRTPACDKHLSRNEEHECPWFKLDEERQYSERMLAAYQEAHRQATENGAAYHALASRLEKCRSALREAMEWNWIDPEGIPEDIVRRCESAAAVERTVTNEETQ